MQKQKNVKGGLTCRKCAECCKHQYSIIVFENMYFANSLKERKIWTKVGEMLNELRQLTENHSCLFLQFNKQTKLYSCIIYNKSYRPKICKTYSCYKLDKNQGG